MTKVRGVSGGGAESRQVKSVGMVTGQPAKATSPGAADQFGQAVGAKRAMREPERGPAYNSGVKLGNEVLQMTWPGGGLEKVKRCIAADRKANTNSPKLAMREME